MSEQASDVLASVRQMDIDPSLLMLLMACKGTVAANRCTASIDSVYYQLALEPFCKGLVSLLPDPGSDTAKQMLEFCKTQSSEFLRSTDEMFASLAEIYRTCPGITDSTLQEIADEVKLNRPNFTHFFRTVSDTLLIDGVRPVTPRKFVSGRGKNAVIDDYKKRVAQWGIHNPFFVQTYDMEEAEGGGKPTIKRGSSVFFIFRTAADGVLATASFLSQRQVCVQAENLTRAVMGVNELTLPGMLCNPVLDLELTTAFYGGRLSLEEMEASMRRFLGKLVGFWDERGIVPADCFTSVSVKNKSRPLPGKDGEFKASMHAVPYVIASKEVHDIALKEFLDALDPATGLSHRALIARAKDLAQNHGGAVPADYTPRDVEFWDFSAGKSNGIAVAGSQKRAQDPFPHFKGIHVFLGSAEMPEDFESCDMPPPHDPALMTESQMTELLWAQCYTTPKLVFGTIGEPCGCFPVSYKDGFVEWALQQPGGGGGGGGGEEDTGDKAAEGAAQAQAPKRQKTSAVAEGGGGGGAMKQTPPEGVDSSGRSTHKPLPMDRVTKAWPIAALQSIRQGEVRVSKDGYQNMRKTLPAGIRDRAEVVMVYRGLCAHDIVTGAIGKGIAKHHDGNGVYVAWTDDPSTVYLACATGSAGHRIDSTKDSEGVRHCAVVNEKSPVMPLSEEERGQDWQGRAMSVDEVEGGFVHWAMLSKEELDELVAASKAAPPPPTPPASSAVEATPTPATAAKKDKVTSSKEVVSYI